MKGLIDCFVLLFVVAGCYGGFPCFELLVMLAELLGELLKGFCLPCLFEDVVVGVSFGFCYYI